MRFVHIAEQAGLDNGLARQRLLRLQADGLVARSGSRHGDPYMLSDAGQALGAVYASVEHWSDLVTPRRAASAPRLAATATSTRAPAGVPLGTGTDGTRTAAALRRSAAASSVMFSHAPQPRVPADVTAQSAPGRSR